MPTTGSGQNAGVRASTHSTACLRRNSPVSGARALILVLVQSGLQVLKTEFVIGRLPSKAGRAGGVGTRVQSFAFFSPALSLGGSWIYGRAREPLTLMCP